MRRHSSTAVFAATVMVAMTMTVTAQIPISDWQPGRSTFYHGIDWGECSYGTISNTSFPFRHIAAPNTAFYNNAAACGGC